MLLSTGALVGCQKAEGCTVFARADGAAVISCGGDTENAVTIKQGQPGTDGTSCTVTKSAGVTSIACEDGTTVSVPDPKDGDDGTSCTVADNDDGTKTISCDDGTEATVSNGAQGDPGSPGHASLVDTGTILTSVCPGGGTVVRVGTDDGDGSGKADDEQLHADEVDSEFIVWSNACQIIEITRTVALIDTWSWGLLPTADHSEDGSLCVGDLPKSGDDTSAQSRAWMRLDTSEAPLEYEKAYLELAATAASGAVGTITIHAIAEPWTAGALDWLNEPAYESASEATPFLEVVDVGENGWVSFDVTAILKAWKADPESDHGLALRSEGSAWACFASSETGLPSSLQPRLVYTGKPDPLNQE